MKRDFLMTNSNSVFWWMVKYCAAKKGPPYVTKSTFPVFNGKGEKPCKKKNYTGAGF